MSALRLAVVAGEPSGDILGGDLVRALAAATGAQPELVGVGGRHLISQGLDSLFDYTELSIIGFSAVILQLPKLILRIRQTADAIIAARPDCLVIIDSPDFSHRVARKVRAALPDLKIINYVCPTVWAWKPERAGAMNAYVDHVLSIFPFEPEIVARLGGPPLTYVGHRLMDDPGLVAAHAAQAARRSAGQSWGPPVCLILPASAPQRGWLRLGRSEYRRGRRGDSPSPRSNPRAAIDLSFLITTPRPNGPSARSSDGRVLPGNVRVQGWITREVTGPRPKWNDLRQAMVMHRPIARHGRGNGPASPELEPA